MTNTKFSAIVSGSGLNPNTDTLLAVRSGTTDVLVAPGTAAAINTGTSGATIPLLNAANTFSAKQTYSAGQYVSGGAIESLIYDAGNSGISLALNMDNGNLQKTTITGAVAITQTAPTHPGQYTLIVTQDGTGHIYSLSGIKWVGGTPPTYSTAANKIDMFTLIYNGSIWLGLGYIAFS